MPLEEIRLSVRGFAETTVAAPARKAAALKKYKFSDSGESVGRQNHYVYALAFIRKYHRDGLPASSAGSYAAELLKRIAEKPDSRQWKAKMTNNARAVQQYVNAFGKEKFTPRPGRNFKFIHQSVIVSARPDLCAESGGGSLFIKVNLTKAPHDELMVNLQLHLMYEAILPHVESLLPSQLVYLQVADGSRLKGPKDGFPSRARIEKACAQIRSVWQSLTE
jgi:hypothetical protein